MAAATSPPPAPPAGARAVRPRLLLVVTWCALAAAVVASGAAAWLLLTRGDRAPAAAPRPAAVFRAGTLIVNVAETDGRRYLRASIELAAGNPRDVRRLEEHRTPILDAAIGVLGSAPLPALLDPAGREALKARLRDRVNETVGGRPVSGVFFTEFVVQ